MPYLIDPRLITALDRLCYRAHYNISRAVVDTLTTKALLSWPAEFEGHSYDSAQEMILARGELLAEKVRADKFRANMGHDADWTDPFE